MSDYSIAIKIGAQLDRNFGATMKAAQNGLTGLNGTTAKGAMSSGKMAAAMAAAGTAAVVAAKGVAIAGQGMAAVGKYSVQVGKDFESAMSSASATASATSEEYTKMKQAAMDMGRSTSKTATESAQALEYMALAGWDVDTSVSALPSVLKMSEASGMDLARTSDLVTDSMAALGVTVDELPMYLDVATKAQNKSNQTAEQLMEAYLGVGGTMKNLNVPITESATALGVLANRGIKGSEAGNALNAIMVNLTTGTGQAGKMMQELGISAFDSQGNFIGLEATLQQLNTALAGCSEEERNAAMAAIGGKQHVDALNNLMAGLNTTNEEGVSEWAALTGELENCNGSLEAMAETKLDNLEGDLAMLDSATQDAGIKIYEHLNGPLREFAQFGTQAVYQVSDALESGGFSGMAAAIGDVVSDGLAMLVSKAPEFLEMGLNMIASFGQGLAKNASGIAQSLMSLIGTAIVTVLKNAPKNIMALGGMAVGLAKGVMVSIGNGIKQAIPQILILVPVLFAKLLGAALHAAPKLITAIPGVIKMGFGAILKLNPISIGIGIMKAVIKGILSMGKNVLGAFKEAIFGGGKDNADAKKAGADAAKGYTAGIDGNADAAANALPALPQAPVGGIGVTEEALPAESLSGQAADIPDTAAGAETTNGEALKATTEQARADIPMDTTQPIEEPAAITDTPPALSITAAVPPETAGAEAQTGNALTEIPAETAQMPAEMENPTSILTEVSADVPAENAQILPEAAIDTPSEAVQMPAETITDTLSETVQVPTLAADAPLEASRLPAEVMMDDTLMSAEQVPVEVIEEIPPEATQPPEAATGALPEAAQLTAETPAMPPKATQMPAEVITDAGQIDNQPETAVLADADTNVAATVEAGTGNPVMDQAAAQDTTTLPADNVLPKTVQALPAGIEMTGAGEGIAQARDTLQTGIAGSLAGQTIDASGINVDSAALSNRMGLAGALGGQSLMNGIGQNIGGIVDVSQVGLDTSGITGEESAQATQLPPQEAVQMAPEEALGGVPPKIAADTETMQGPVHLPADIPQTGADMQVSPEEETQKTGMAQILPMLSGFLKMVSAIGSGNPVGVGGGAALGLENLSAKVPNTTDVAAVQAEQAPKDNPWEPPKPDTPLRNSIIGETLDKLSSKNANQEIPASSGSSPQFVYSPTIHVEGSGDVKEDVEKASRMGMREFEELMEAYLNKNKRVKFG